MLILIPAYKPDTSLVQLARDIDQQAKHTESTVHLLVINDGSGTDYIPVFEQVANLPTAAPAPSLERRLDRPGLSTVTVLHLPANGGKGAALRAGLAWAQQNLPHEPVITADADGQHLAQDILAVGQATQNYTDRKARCLVLGIRTLQDPAESQHRAPLRSRVGNALTAALFRISTGKNIADTQTGLRGLTPQIIPWALELPGDRYEYEFTMLLRASRHHVELAQVPITKVYEEGNPTSHFQPVRDSIRIYAPLLAFLAASFSSFIIDTLALLILVAAGMAVIPAVFAARIISALGNFALNRVILHDGGPRPSAQRSLGRYAILALVILALNSTAMEALTRVCIPLLAAKILVEGALIPLSFSVQRRWVFARATQGEQDPQLSSRRTDERGTEADLTCAVSQLTDGGKELSPNSSDRGKQTSKAA
ncbi:GtrA family protein [Rothia sp. P5764]|uniref:GtrA family protein n=1 Tax=Rothia sp. P5764 TaxID=3402654 RepID=UPI003ACD8B3C